MNGYELHSRVAPRSFSNSPYESETTLPAASLVAVVLAGGLSRRMGRMDKAFLLLNGQTLLQRVLGRLSPQVATIMINANGEAAHFASFALPVVTDCRPHHPGPLAGIEAALLASNADWLLSIPVDLPFLPLDLAERLLMRADANTELVIAAGPTGRHPVVGLWSRCLLPAISATLGHSSPRLFDWIEEKRYVVADFPLRDDGIDPFFNINYPHDLDVAQSLLSKGIDATIKQENDSMTRCTAWKDSHG
ncbi:molybdenum cofactor guanylyltransferase [Gammaproteobacteria bacterium]